MNSNNAADPDSTATETRTLLMDLACREETTLETYDVSEIMNRIRKCSNGDDLRNLLTAPGIIPKKNPRLSLEERVLFVAAGLDDGFEKSMEIVTAAGATKPRSDWTTKEKRALRREMRRIDAKGGKSRFEEPGTWANTTQEEQSSAESSSSQDIDAAGRRELQYEYDERKQDVVDDLL